jgi:hypothetical protein
MRLYIYPLFILIGVFFGWLFPFYALTLGRWSFLFLVILLLLNMFPVNLKPSTVFNYTKKDFYFLFFSYFFIPSLIFVFASKLNVRHSIVMGFFMTNLAPFAIITPQFMCSSDEKLIALRQIITATFTFPIYFTLMLFLFFTKTIKFSIFSIVKDSLLLTLFPILIIFILNTFFKDLKLKIQSSIADTLPILNLLIIGILSFIFVGSSYLKNDISVYDRYDWIAIIALALFQDFGTYYIAKFFEFSETYRTVLSMKNVPFVGIFALIFFPQALVPTISILIVHTLLVLFHSFNFRKQTQNLS